MDKVTENLMLPEQNYRNLRNALEIINILEWIFDYLLL